MARFRIGLVCLASVFCAGFLPIGLTGGSVTAAAADPPTCALPAPVAGVITLTSDCDTTQTLMIPNGVTLNGAGHTITAHDLTPGSPSDNTVVLENATGATSMSIENLTIVGNFTPGVPGCRTTLNGIWFNGAGGSVTNTTVTGITEHGNCQLGRAIVANGTAGQTLTITSTTVTDYQKSAIQATGMTMNVSGSFIGPPSSLSAPIGQNGLLYLGGSTGTTSGSTIYGSGYGGAANANGAVLVLSATNVTLTDDTITGDRTDLGVDVEDGGTGPSTGVIIDSNQIGRTAPDVPDTFGFGVQVISPSTATVTCNSFSGWRTDLVGVAQPLCVTTTAVPDGVVGTPYSTDLNAFGGTPPNSWSVVSGSLPPGLALSSTGTISGTPTVAGSFTFTLQATDSMGASATRTLTVTITAPPGYWLAASDGGVFAFGSATFHGSGANTHLNAPVVAMANTATGGYWLAASDGGVFSYGTTFFGSLGGIHLNAPIVGIAATPDDGGYYLVGADGGVFAFGDANFHGSLAGKALNKPVVGIAVTPDNGGYYLATADGAVFTYGDAVFQGSMGDTPLNKPVVGIAVDDTTSGYWLVAGDGGVFGFSAPFLGSTGSIHLNAPVVAMTARGDGLGYWLVASDGGVFAYGSAPFFGSMGGTHLNKPVVATASVG